MELADATAEANAAVARWIIKQYRKGGRNKHLASCPDLAAGDVTGEDSSYGCDTGCEYVRLEADMSCPHGERECYAYGKFGELAYILEDIEADER